MKSNIVGWFEIPVTDMERAIKFYEKVLDIELEKQKNGKEFMTWFLFKEDGFGSSPKNLLKQNILVLMTIFL